MIRFSRLMASSLTGISVMSATSHSSPSVAPRRAAYTSRLVTVSPMAPAMVLKYPSTGCRKMKRASRSRTVAAIAQFLFEQEPPARNQVVPDVMAPVVLGRRQLRLAGEGDGAARDRHFRLLRAPRQLLDGMAVAVARRKIHLDVRAGRIFSKRLLDQSDAIEKQRPLNRREQSHARDHVPDRELIGRFALMLDPQHLLRSVALRLQRTLQRLPGGSRRGGLIAQPLQQFDDEGRRQSSVRLELGPEELVDGAGRIRSPVRQERDPPASLAAAAARRHHAVGQPAQFLDQRDAKHDGHRPRFAHRERRDALVRGHEVHERVEIQPAGRVRDQLARDHVDARVARQRTARELRKLDVVLLGQIASNLADLILDDVIVVAQPVFGADRWRAGAGLGLKELVRGVQLPRALVETGKERPAGIPIRREPVRLRQRDRVRLELFLTEQLGPAQPLVNGCLRRGVRSRRCGVGHLAGIIQRGRTATSARRQPPLTANNGNDGATG